MKRVESSETIRTDQIFNEWLAGVLDGDGCFYINKDKVVSIEITVATEDSRILHHIKDIIGGGAVKPRSGSRSVRYRIASQSDVVKILTRVSGEIRIRTEKYKEACTIMGVPYKPAGVLTLESSYMAGLVDTDGTIVYNKANNQIRVVIANKRKENLTFIPIGTIYYSKSGYGHYVVQIEKLADITRMVEYFNRYRLYSDKKYKRVLSIKRFLEIRSYKKSADPVQVKIFETFIKKFE